MPAPLVQWAEDRLSDGDERLPLMSILSGKAPAEGDPGDIAQGREDA